MRLATVVVEGARAPKMVAALTVDGEELMVDLTQAYASYLFTVGGEQFADDLAQARLQGDMLRFLQGGERSMLAAKRTVDYAREQLAGLDVRAAWRAASMLWPLESVRFLPPILRPGKLLLSGEIKRPEAHVKMAETRHPGSSKLTSAQVGHDEPIVRDSRRTTKLDYEAELAVVIGKRCKDIRPEDAFDVVAGFTCINDVTMRDVQDDVAQFGNTFTAKNFVTSAPVGPYLVTKDEVPDPQDLQIQVRVNGIVQQDDNTRNMVFPVADIIAYWSRMTLEPGDIVATGTSSGVIHAQDRQGFLEPGDEIELEITNIGILRNRVVSQADVPAGPLSAGVFAERG